jgi:hypothetical protein
MPLGDNGQRRVGRGRTAPLGGVLRGKNGAVGRERVVPLGTSIVYWSAGKRPHALRQGSCMRSAVGTSEERGGLVV